MSLERAQWYLDRASAMSGPELFWRLGDKARQLSWRRRHQRTPVTGVPEGTAEERAFAVVPRPGALHALDPLSVKRLVASADQMLDGHWQMLGAMRHDIADPDWFLDLTTGVRSNPDRYAFSIDHRDESREGNVKQVWELSRHHHLTLLAAAWNVTRDDRYADTIASQLRSWWGTNPYLSGVHWVCGIEVGMRLISWAWIRRLLDDWSGARQLFDNNEVALHQIYWHQEYLAAFRSRGTSANNHVIAEAVGAVIGSVAFPWYARSSAWEQRARTVLQSELKRNTSDDGLNREMASEYAVYVAELGLLAAVECQAASRPLSEETVRLLAATVDSVAASLDVRGRPPRAGDGDDAQGLLVDDPGTSRVDILLDSASALVARADWWPVTTSSVEGALLGALNLRSAIAPSGCRAQTGPVDQQLTGRPGDRPAIWSDGGMTVLRTPPSAGPEIWCRCDGGPHGFMSIAAHAHADALSVEVRHDGVDILADPGTYCYHGQRKWRHYFRSTLAHNTLSLDGMDQARSAGPFIWKSHPQVRTIAQPDLSAPLQTWVGEHDGYQPVTHRRSVTLDSRARSIVIVDELADVGPGRRISVAFHLGPDVALDLDGSTARLAWGAGTIHRGVLELPAALAWTPHRGETSPPLGWYSPRFGEKVPSTTLIGTGTSREGAEFDRFTTVLAFLDESVAAGTAVGVAASP